METHGGKINHLARNAERPSDFIDLEQVLSYLYDRVKNYLDI